MSLSYISKIMAAKSILYVALSLSRYIPSAATFQLQALVFILPAITITLHFN